MQQYSTTLETLVVSRAAQLLGHFANMGGLDEGQPMWDTLWAKAHAVCDKTTATVRHRGEVAYLISAQDVHGMAFVKVYIWCANTSTPIRELYW